MTARGLELVGAGDSHGGAFQLEQKCVERREQGRNEEKRVQHRRRSRIRA